MRARRSKWATDERDALLRELWPTYTLRGEICARLAELPGGELPEPYRVAIYAGQVLGLSRPPGYKHVQTAWWTDGKFAPPPSQDKCAKYRRRIRSEDRARILKTLVARGELPAHVVGSLQPAAPGV